MKENIENNNWTLIAKYLGKELDTKEKQQFDEWLDESEENRKELANAQKIWATSNFENAELFSTDQGWVKMENRLHQNPVKKSAKEKQLYTQVLKIAASFLILISIGALIFWLSGTGEFIKITAGDQKIISPVILPDGTKVCLNIGATLRYPKTFKQSNRTVELTGEAFFDVTHNAKQPFIILTPRAQIKVLGTSFNVAAYKGSDSVQVVVETGTVELSPKTNDNIIKLTKGNTGAYYAKENKLLKSTGSDINATSWKTNIIIFKDVDLSYVTKTLHKLFSKSFLFNDEKLKNCRVNSDFKNANLDSILKTIQILNNVNIKKTNSGYIISGHGC